MHTHKRYRLMQLLAWTSGETVLLTFTATIPTVLVAVYGWTWLTVPWVPVAMLGTASAFTVGFRNNATYNRAWEARQIWGGIVNATRAWAISVRDLITPAGPAGSEAEALRRRLIYRHIAWLTALRYQLRESRPWETANRHDNVAFRRRYFTVPEHDGQLDQHLRALLDAAECTAVAAQPNRASALLAHQSAELAELARDGSLEPNRQVALTQRLIELYDLQGRCERIKNFPYPRQFATLNYWFIRMFVLLVPFGMIQEFRRLDDALIGLTVPFSVIVTWIFLALEKVGESTENPFEGSANDVPISTMSRTLEIELRRFLGEEQVPPPLQPSNGILL